MTKVTIAKNTLRPRDGLFSGGLIIVSAKTRHFQRLLRFGLKSVASQVS